MTPIDNLKEFLEPIVKALLKYYPRFVAVITVLFLLIMGFLLFLFNGFHLEP